MSKSTADNPTSSLDSLMFPSNAQQSLRTDATQVDCSALWQINCLFIIIFFLENTKTIKKIFTSYSEVSY